MVTNTEKILIRIEADIAQLKGSLQTISGDLKSFSKNIDTAKGSVDGFDRVIQKFSVQTFAQGLLNISTSAAQVYTSFSNLDRAANQVQSSLVALHKAEDQIERKQIQLTKAINQYGYSSEKAAMINDELATAEEQLAVKTERHRLAVDQLRDTQILMVSNLVNTGFGALQTIASLHAMVSTRLKANTIDTAINTAEKAKQNAVVGASGAPFAVLNGSLTANTAANRVNMISQLGLGAAVRANPLMLPLTIATIAIGIGTTVYAMNEMGKTTSNLTGEINKSSGAVDDLSGSWSEAVGSMTTFNNGLVAGTTYANGYTAALDRVKQANEALIKAEEAEKESKDFFKFKSPEEKIAAAKDVIDKKALLDASVKASQEAMKEEVKISMMRKSLYTNVNGVLQDPITLHLGGKMTLEQLKAFESLGDKVQEITKLYEEHGTAHDIAFTKALELEKENIQLKGYTIEQVRKQISAEEVLNNIKDKGYKNEKQNLKEIQELKKKLSLEYGFTKPGSNRRSFIAGETNFFNPKTGIPFAGVINRKSGELAFALKQREDFDLINGVLDGSHEMVKSGKWTAGEAREFIEKSFKHINLGQNIISSLTGKDTATKAINTMLSGMSKSKIGMSQKVAGEMINQYSKNIIQQNKLADIRSAAAARTSFNKSQARDLGVRTSSSGKALTQAKGGKKRRGHNVSQPMTYEDYFRAFSPNASSSTISELSRLSGVDIMAGIPDPVSFMKAQANWSSHIHYRNPNYLKELQAWNARTESYQNTINQRVAQANSIISGGRATIGQGLSELEALYGFDVVVDQEVVSRIEQTLGYRDTSAINVKEQLLATLAGDEKYYNVDDRLRFTDKLAQISTGATVI